MNVAKEVLKRLRESEPWRPDNLLLYSPDQVRKAIEAAVKERDSKLIDAGLLVNRPPE